MLGWVRDPWCFVGFWGGLGFRVSWLGLGFRVSGEIVGLNCIESGSTHGDEFCLSRLHSLMVFGGNWNGCWIIACWVM